MVLSMVNMFYSMFSHFDTKELLLTDSNNQMTSCMLCKFVYVTVWQIAYFLWDTDYLVSGVYWYVHTFSVNAVWNQLLKKTEKYTNATNLRHF